MRIEKYQIVVGPSSHMVDTSVNIWLKAGWEPYGYLTVADGYMYQVMVKYQEHVVQDRGPR